MAWWDIGYAADGSNNGAGAISDGRTVDQGKGRTSRLAQENTRQLRPASVKVGEWKALLLDATTMRFWSLTLLQCRFRCGPG